MDSPRACACENGTALSAGIARLRAHSAFTRRRCRQGKKQVVRANEPFVTEGYARAPLYCSATGEELQPADEEGTYEQRMCASPMRPTREAVR
eukprot:1153086-Pelagomonas_calceolata.AAC.2